MKKVKAKTPINLVNISLNKRYNFLMEEEGTMESVDDGGRPQPKKRRVKLLAQSKDFLSGKGSWPIYGD